VGRKTNSSAKRHRLAIYAVLLLIKNNPEYAVISHLCISIGFSSSLAPKDGDILKKYNHSAYSVAPPTTKITTTVYDQGTVAARPDHLLVPDTRPHQFNYIPGATCKFDKSKALGLTQ